jgi:hypothetical protein
MGSSALDRPSTTEIDRRRTPGQAVAPDRGTPRLRSNASGQPRSDSEPPHESAVAGNEAGPHKRSPGLHAAKLIKVASRNGGQPTSASTGRPRKLRTKTAAEGDGLVFSPGTRPHTFWLCALHNSRQNSLRREEPGAGAEHRGSSMEPARSRLERLTRGRWGHMTVRSSTDPIHDKRVGLAVLFHFAIWQHSQAHRSK